MPNVEHLLQMQILDLFLIIGWLFIVIFLMFRHRTVSDLKNWRSSRSRYSGFAAKQFLTIPMPYFSASVGYLFKNYHHF